MALPMSPTRPSSRRTAVGRPTLVVAPDKPPRPLGTVRAVVLDSVGTMVPLEGLFETALVEALSEVGVDAGEPGSATRTACLHALAACPTPAMLGLFLGDDRRASWAHQVFETALTVAGLRRPPYPDTVLTAMLRIGVDAVHQVAVVGDTVADLVAGTSAGASIVVGVLGGAHALHELTLAPHTHLLGSIAELPDVLPISV